MSIIFSMPTVGGANGADADDPVVIAKLIRGEDVDRAVLPYGQPGTEHPCVWTTASAGAEDTGAYGY